MNAGEDAKTHVHDAARVHHPGVLIQTEHFPYMPIISTDIVGKNVYTVNAMFCQEEKTEKKRERYDNEGTVTLRFTDCSERFPIRNKDNMNL